MIVPHQHHRTAGADSDRRVRCAGRTCCGAVARVMLQPFCTSLQTGDRGLLLIHDLMAERHVFGMGSSVRAHVILSTSGVQESFAKNQPVPERIPNLS